LGQTDPTPSPDLNPSGHQAVPEISTPSGAVSRSDLVAPPQPTGSSASAVNTTSFATRPPEGAPADAEESRSIEQSHDRLAAVGDAREEAPVSWWRRLLFGRPKDVRDRHIFHSLSLVAFLAWVGLGADPLSSSAYGPAEAFKELKDHRYLAVALALATALTVTVLSMSYSRIIEHFPGGGGGYVVATKLLGPWPGLTSGCALLVDYVLTITVSVAAAGDALFSFFGSIPAEQFARLEWWEKLEHAQTWKLPSEFALIGLLIWLNLRGVKESVQVLMPIFIVFLLTHAFVIFGGMIFHARDIGPRAVDIGEGFAGGYRELGLLGLAALFLRAYSMGGGTYTGIEAVSNSMPILREPRVATAKRTMVYLAVSLAATSAGLLFCYLLFDLRWEEHRTLNAVLTDKLVGVEGLDWGGWGRAFLLIVLISEGALLIVAAQAGFIAGPQTMSNMAVDSWMPHRFSSLSERLTASNGIVIMGAASLAALLYTGGRVDQLVVMYSINVFVTFTLSQLAMVRYWLAQRGRDPHWLRRSLIFWVALMMCAGILGVTVFEKFTEGGWITLAVTGSLFALCAVIRSHYRAVGAGVLKLDSQLNRIGELIPPAGPPREIDPRKPTAILMVGSYSGLGIHTLLSILRFLPNHFHNVLFVSVGVVDSGNFKGASEVDQLRRHVKDFLRKYVELAQKLGLAADFRYGLGIDPVDEGEKICLALAKEFPHCMFFVGKLLFQKEGWFQRLLHNETANALQRRLQWADLPVIVLPARVQL
jgi:amino acid transporter